MTDNKNWSEFLSSSSRLPPNSCRPKVVLVNPNFQRKQATTQKTIYINPLFKSASAPNKQVSSSNLTWSASSSNLKEESTQIVNTESASFTNTLSSLKQNLKFSNSIAKPPNRNGGIKSLALKTSDTCSALSSSYSQFGRNNQIESIGGKFTAQDNVGLTVCQPKKTYVNRKFLKNPVDTNYNTEKKASFFYINASKLKPEEVTPRIRNDGSAVGEFKFSCTDSKSKTLPLSAIDNTNIVAKENSVNPVTACPVVNNDAQNKSLVKSNSENVASSSTSPALLKLTQKKKLNLLRLRKITRLAQLAQISRMRRKDFKANIAARPSSTNSIKNFGPSSKFAMKLFSPKLISRQQNSLPYMKNNFPNRNLLSFKQNSTKKLNDGPSNKPNFCTQPRQRSVLKKCSKFKLVRSEVIKCNLAPKLLPTNSLVPENSFKLTNQLHSKKNQQSSISLTRFNLRKFDQLNELELHQGNSITTSSEKNESPVCAPNTNTGKLLFISNQKLVRKPPIRKATQQKTRSFISKNKLIRNFNLTETKNCTASFKIHFKPSRTSADVINKRMIQRKVINRYKLLNVQQNQVKAGRLVKNKGKQIILRKERRNSVIRNKNSSFVSLGKRKLIRKSVMNLKRPTHSKYNFINNKVKVNNLKPISTFISKNQKRYAQKYSWKATESGRNTKTVNNDLIAFGRTKLIKKSLLHWQRQINKLNRRQNNVAAKSVMQKQLRKLYKSLPESRQNEKFLKVVQVNKLKLRNLLNSSRNKTLTKRRIALRCKNNIPCETFHKYGRCKKFILGKCAKLHDKKYITICQAFIHGACKADRCFLSHEILPQKMPTCLHFLQGACSRDNCPYPHVKLSAKAPVCRDFVKGYCSLGLDCDKVHMLLCPELEKNGVCTNRPNCKFAHRKKSIAKKTPPDKSIEKKQTSDSAVTEQSSKLENNIGLNSETNDEPAKRYFVNSSENELESFIPKRPQLGSLPSFIPLNSCDSLKNS